MACCQITLLILLCLVIGFIVGVWISDEYSIAGLKDLSNKITDAFKKASASNTS